MKSAVRLLVLLLAGACVYAAAPIEWSKNVKLTQRDFRGKVPASATDTAHSWVGLDVAWECREGEARSHARAIFDPDQSWWRTGTPSIWGGINEGLSRSQLENRRTAAERDQDLLRHEQLHFDLTELSARKIRRQFEDLPRACATPAGDSRISAAILDIERAWTDEQSRYDNDTDHGANRVTQRPWELRVLRQLER
jgi:uncharacterized protein DUF922